MANQILTLKQLENFFVATTCKMLGLDMTKTENLGKVRKAWPVDGAPTWKIAEDIVFMRITPQDDKLTRQLNIIYTPSTTDSTKLVKKTGYTRVHKIDWTLYGSLSYDNADLIRISLFADEYLQTFKDNNLFLITDVQMPTRLPELYNGQWWERTDFSATFNESVIREGSTPIIDSTNFVILKNR